MWVEVRTLISRCPPPQIALRRGGEGKRSLGNSGALPVAPLRGRERGGEGMAIQIAALAILAAFYGVYLGKMLAQRRRGIRTDQMARGNKRGRLFWTELLLKGGHLRRGPG